MQWKASAPTCRPLPAPWPTGWKAIAAALRRLADAAEEIAAWYELAEQRAAADELRTLGAFAPTRPGMEPPAPDPAPALTPMLGETVMARFRDA